MISMIISKNRAVKLLQNLVRINSENPPGDCANISKIIVKEMRKIGMKTNVFEFRKNNPNVVGILKGNGKGKKKELLLVAHMDTVPAGKGWKYDPFSAKIKNGKLYGRGSADCKINIVACLEAVRKIIKSGKKLKGNLVIAITSDEETGSCFGLKPLIEKKILNPDYAVVVDHNSFSVIISQKGLIDMRVEILGKKAHGAYPWLGVSAIEKAASVITDLKKYKFRFRKHPLLREPTINIGTIYGGEKVNIVADRCSFEIDLRYLPGMNANKIIHDLKKIISKRTKKFNFNIMDHQAPYEIDKNQSVVNQLIKSMKKFKKSASICGSEGAAPLVFFRKRNAVATGFGPENVAHMTDEYVNVKDIDIGAKSLEDFIISYLEYEE